MVVVAHQKARDSIKRAELLVEPVTSDRTSPDSLRRVVAFDRDSSLRHELDFRLASSAVSMFWRRSVLDDAVNELIERGYHVVNVDAALWSTADDVHDSLAVALGFPDYYGRNLNALDDCMSDVADGDLGWPADEATGFVLVLLRFDAFAGRDPWLAHHLLGVIGETATQAALIGHRVMALVQSDDPDIGFERLRGRPVGWNDAEWLDERRR